MGGQEEKFESSSRRLSSYTLPGTKLVSRSDIFNDQDDLEQVADDQETANKMDALMQQLLAPSMEEIPASNVEPEQETKEPEEDGFAFRLFSSKPVSKVNISGKDDTADVLAALVAKQQKVEHDETDPEFRARVEAAAISYEEIMTQSHWAYPALRFPRRLIHIKEADEPAEQETKKKAKKKRKSKKQRDFEKAVREGRIKVKPNMRDPRVPGGWPGWPGERTRCNIITNIEKDLKRKSNKPGRSTKDKRGGRLGRGGSNIRGRGRINKQK